MCDHADYYDDDLEDDPFDVALFKNIHPKRNPDGTYRWHSQWRQWASNDALAAEVGKQQRKLQGLKDRLEEVVQYRGYAEEHILELEEEISRREGENGVSS